MKSSILRVLLTGWLAVALPMTGGLWAAAPAPARDPVPLADCLAKVAPALLAIRAFNLGYAVDLTLGQEGAILRAPTVKELPAGRYRLHALVSSTPHGTPLVDAVELRLRVAGAQGRFERLKHFPKAGEWGEVALDFEVKEPRILTIEADWLVGETMLEPNLGAKKAEAMKLYLAQRQNAINKLALARETTSGGLKPAASDDDLLGDLAPEGQAKAAATLAQRSLAGQDLPEFRLLLAGVMLEPLSPLSLVQVQAEPAVVEAGQTSKATVLIKNHSAAEATGDLTLALDLGEGPQPWANAKVTVPAQAELAWTAPDPLPVSRLRELGHVLAELTVVERRPDRSRGQLLLAPPIRPAKERPKQIYAHYMGCWPVGVGPLRYEREQHLPIEFRHESQDAAMARGGHVRNFDLVPPGLPMTWEESADLEIRRALRIGIDGFALDAWAGDKDARKSLDALFAAAEKGDYPFSITLCIDPVTGGNITESVKYLLERHGKSPKLARRDGQPLIFGYQSVWSGYGWLLGKLQSSEAVLQRTRATPLGWHLLGQAYSEAERQVGQPIYYHFDLAWFFHNNPHASDDLLPAAAAALARHVEAIGSFKHEKGLDQIAAAVKANGAEWSGAVGMYQKENIPFETYTPPGTEWLEGQWDALRRQDATLVQFITWNDYGENTAIAPGWDTRYTLYDLTGYHIAWWKTGKPPVLERDRVYLTYAKYPREAKVWPFASGVSAKRALEVLTILTAPATIKLPGREVEYEAPAGYSRKQFPLTPGPVSAELWRGGARVLRLDSPEPISDRPFRESNGFVCYSSEFERHWRADFGERPVTHYAEYGDADGDGLPNWFEMYWFSEARKYKPLAGGALDELEGPKVKYGRWLDFSTAIHADPKADPDGDGQTNLQEYQARTDPTVAPAASLAPKAGDDLLKGAGQSGLGEGL